MSVITFLLSGWGPEERTTFLYSVAALGSFYVLARALNEAKWDAMKDAESGNQRERRKARSWLLSIAVSCVMSFLGVLYAAELAAEFTAGGSSALTTFLLSDAGPAARASAAFFAAFCVLDLSVGLVDYREHIGVDTGYVHHSVYLLLVSVLLALQQAGALASFGVCEIPTFILAVGSAHKPWRLDLPMGVTFFLTRILYMSLMAVAVAGGGYVWQPITLCALVALHIKWFWAWQRSYRKLLSSRATAPERGSDGGKSIHAGVITGMPTPGPDTSPTPKEMHAGARATHLTASSAGDRPAHGGSESGSATEASPLMSLGGGRNSGVAAAAAALAAGVELLGDATRPRVSSKLD